MSRRRTIALGAGSPRPGRRSGAGERRASRPTRSTRTPSGPRPRPPAPPSSSPVRAVRRADLAQTYAPAIATAVEPLLHGRRYFPRMLEDIAAATDHVHLLIYGYKAGRHRRDLPDRAGRPKVGGRRRGPAVGRRHRQRGRLRQQGPVPAAARGGRRGRRPRRDRRRPVRRPGGPLVPAARRGPAPFRPSQDGRHRRPGRLRRRQRHRGPLQRRALLRRHVPGRGADRRPAPVGLPAQLAPPRRAGARRIRPSTRYFPTDDAAGRARRRVPGADDGPVERPGHRPPPDQRRDRDGRSRTPREQIHIVNPYISNRAILERILAAALRGVRVRLIAPGKPTPPYPAAAFRHWYGRLLDAGVEILLHPRDGPRQGPAHRRPGPHRRLQPRRPVALPQRRAGPAVRGPGGRRADRADASSTSWPAMSTPADRVDRRPGTRLERHDGPRLAVPVASGAGARRRMEDRCTTTRQRHAAYGGQRIEGESA